MSQGEMKAPLLAAFKVKNETLIIKRQTLIEASVFFKDLFDLPATNEEDSEQSLPIIQETCKVSELRAFVKSIAVFKRDEISYCYFKETKLSASLIEQCVPLVHKYECNGIMKLCFDAIQASDKACRILWADAVAIFERYFGGDPRRSYDFNENALRCLAYYYDRTSNKKKMKEHVSQRTLAQLAALLLDDARVARKRKHTSTDNEAEKKKRTEPSSKLPCK